jgi:isoquinoline 1-oxidoreductase beta subunit
MTRGLDKDAGSVSRRTVLKGVAAGGLLTAFHFPLRAVGAVPREHHGRLAPNAFIRIDRAGIVRLVMPQAEMGQGIYTSIAMILAEELDADFARVVLEHAPASDRLYGNPLLLGAQVTGNSNSIRAYWEPLRRAGASTRALLVQAAAARWSVDVRACATVNGEVTHPASGRRLPYGELVDDAAALPVIGDAPLKDRSSFTLVGKPLKRLDARAKVNGEAVFGIDVRLPGMKFATICASPVLGGKVRRVDDAAAKAVPGVHKVIVLDDLVAVVGDHMWAVKRGLEALKIDWDGGPHARVSSRQLWDELRLASRGDGIEARTSGNPRQALSKGVVFEAAYELPLLAHATMEPMNCTVQLRPDGCDIWIGTQVMTRVQQTVAGFLGMPLDKVTVHNHLIGGGFGRRLEADMALTAARVAQHVDGAPVKVVWTREEDIRHDIVRPMYRDVVAATVSRGRINALTYKVCGSSVLARWAPPAFEKGIIDAVEGAVDMPYDIPNFQVRYVRAEPKAVQTGFWRGVANNNNVFALECFIDEAARRVGQDPVAFRLRMLDKAPRLRSVLQRAASISGWGRSLPKRVGLGVCAQPSFESFIATIVEVEVDVEGEIDVRRVTSVVDTGIAINPDTIVAQLEGGLIFGLTAALYGEVTLADGRIEQSNFHDYSVMRINQAPKIDVHLIESDEPPGGIGETGTTAAPPALRNAIYAATGIALRRLPIDSDVLAGRKPPWR